MGEFQRRPGFREVEKERWIYWGRECHVFGKPRCSTMQLVGQQLLVVCNVVVLVVVVETRTVETGCLWRSFGQQVSHPAVGVA